MLAAAQVEAQYQKALINGGHINLKINFGKDLVARDTSLFSKSTSDPFIIIKSGGKRIVGQTKVISKNLNPIWNESFQFDMIPKESPLILLEIFDKDKITSNDPMGIVTIPLTLLLSNNDNNDPDTNNNNIGNSIEKDFIVEKCKGVTENQLGIINLSISFDSIIPTAIKSGDIVNVPKNNKLTIGLGWDVEPTKKRQNITHGGKNGGKGNHHTEPKVIDLDASAVIFDKKGQLIESIYFDNLVSTKSSGEGAIVHLGDSITGDDVIGGDDEKIQIDLNRLKPQVLAIYVCVCAFSDNTSFEDVLDATCRIYDINEINLFECHLGKLGLRTAVTMVRIFRDPSSNNEWKMASLFMGDSTARSWGFLIPQFKNNLGLDLVPGLKGKKSDRIAIMSKGQSFKIADTCDDIPDVFCTGLYWDVTDGKNIDLDASILLLDYEYKLLDFVAYDKLMTKNLAIRHMGDEREGDEVGDDEKIIIDFNKLNKNVSYLCVVINSFSGQELDDVKDAGCHIFDNHTLRDICKINLTNEKSMDGKTCCFTACFFKLYDSWWIKSVNQGMMGRACRQSLPSIKKYLQSEDLINNKIMEITLQQSAQQSFVSMTATSENNEMNNTMNETHSNNNMNKAVGVAGGVGIGVGVAAGVGVGVAAGVGSSELPTNMSPNVNMNNVHIQEPNINNISNISIEEPNISSIDLSPSLDNIKIPISHVVNQLGDMNLSLNTDIALAGISNLASLSNNIPFISVLSPIMSGIVDAARDAKYNQLAAKLLSDRIIEIASILYDLLKTIPNPNECESSLQVELQRLQPLLLKCRGFMNKYSKRSYLSKMFCGYSDGENLKILDKGLSDVVQSITMSLGVMNVSMMQGQYQKLDQLADLVRSTGSSTQSGEPMSEDSDMVKTIAKCVGVETKEVVSEIQSSLDAIMKSQETMNNKLDRALNLLDATSAAVTGTNTSKPPPEDPKTFWDEYFGAEKSVGVELFIPVFEEEFCPEEVEELTIHERQSLINMLDAYPHDGLVSIVEWKRFCKQSTRAGLGLYDFIKYLTTNQ